MHTFRNIVLSALVAMSAVSTVSAANPCEPVNVNTADARDIADALFRVGPVKSEAIVAYREEHGDFSTADDLDDVFGIGEGIINLNEGCILVQ